jgi:hypothetical protein
MFLDIGFKKTKNKNNVGFAGTVKYMKMRDLQKFV